MTDQEKFFVNSSFIEHIVWQRSSKSLIITFASGSIWLYKGVPKKVYTSFCAAKSLGAYFNKKIRNSYEGVPIARVGKSSVIVYSKGEEIVETKEKTQEQAQE
jgi:hypothetical protein